MNSAYVVYDIETTGLSPLYDGGRITCICAKDNVGGWFAKTEHDEESLILQFLGWLYAHDPETHTWPVKLASGKSPFRMLVNRGGVDN